MYPLLKIRLIYFKRHFIKNFFEFFYPCIYIFLISLLFNKNNISETIDFYSNINNSNNLNYKKFSIFSLFSKKHIKILYNEQIGIITNNSNLKNLFEKYLYNNYCYLNCNIISFKNYNQFNNYINSEYYLNESKFSSVFYFKGDFPEMNIEIFTDEIKIKSIKENKNNLFFQQNLIDLKESEKNILKYINYNLLLTNFFNENFFKSKQKFRIYYSKLINQPIINKLSSNELINLIPMIIGLSYSSILFTFVLWMVKEKEKKLKIFLNRLGIKNRNYIISWLFTFIIVTFFPILLLSYLIHKNFFLNIKFFIIYLSFQMFNLNIFSLSYFLQYFLTSVQTSQTLLKIMYIGLTILSGIITGTNSNKIFKFIFNFFPQIIQIENFEILFLLDNYKEIDYNLLTANYNDINLLEVYLFYIISTCLCYFIPFLISKYKYLKKNQNNLININNNSNEYNELKNIKNDTYLKIQTSENNISIYHQELTNTTSKNFLNISNITKIFNNNFTAVDDVSIELYDGIFALLGHNGAGKTTLINIISLILPANNGKIFLNKKNIFSDKKYLYNNIGLCNQEDIFFEYLTVNEHLKLVSEIKRNVNISEINDLLIRLDLLDKKNSLCSTLSGGQKRKLCIAMALCGNSKLILLDEPTSGMDIISKRKLWKFLKEYKNDKIILLTTHSLEEAEILGDRIGIMLDGKLICSGTSSYLKNKYPCGINVNIVFNENFKKKMFLKKIKKNFVKINTKNLLSINLDIENTEEIFDIIKETKGIENYSISTTNLEDVFLKINNKEIIDDLDSDNIEENNNDEINNKNKNYYELMKHLKRLLIPLWRNKSNFLFEIFSASITLFIYILGINSIFNDNVNSTGNINKLLNINDIYYVKYKDYNNIFENSKYFKKYHPNFILLNSSYFINDDEINIISISKKFYNLSKYKNEKILFTSDYNENNNITNFYILFNDNFQENFQLILNLIYNSYFQTNFNLSFTINSYSYLPNNIKPNENKFFKKIFMIFYSIIMIWNSFVSLNTYMINTPLKDRLNNLKHLFYLSGFNLKIYWFSIFIIDCLKFFIFLLITFPLLLYVDEFFKYYLIIFIFFIFSSNLFVYNFTFFFQKEEDQKIYLLIVMILSLLFPGATFYLNKFKNIFDIKFYYSLSDLIPHSSLIIAMVRIIYFKKYMNKNVKKIILNHILLFLIQCLVYIFFIIIFEKKYFQILLNKIYNLKNLFKKNINQNQNLFNEIDNIFEKRKNKINNNNLFTSIILNLNKTFFICCKKNVHAVNNINILLEPNEKFGLLGYNGAGKTTTFKCITNELIFDSGKINFFQENFSKNFQKIRKFIGYCPQENVLFDYLTVEENLNFFGSNQLFNSLKVSKNNYAINLSGGNKRKLNFSISFLKNKKLFLLDEPSSGVDAESRRIMWKYINNLKSKQQFNLILSTHSMEEAEVLCDIVGWMKEGKFKICGYPEELKIKYSNGYFLAINMLKYKQIHNIEEEFEKNLGENYINDVDEKDKGVINEIYCEIKNICGKIEVAEFNKEYRMYKLKIQVIINLQEQFFKKILNYKIKNKEYMDISLNMESLENILTKFD